MRNFVFTITTSSHADVIPAPSKHNVRTLFFKLTNVYFRTVYCGMTYHNKDHEMRASHKTTSLAKLINLIAGGLVFSRLIGFFFLNNNIQDIFLVFTVSLVRK